MDIEMRIKEAIEESGISLLDLERITGIDCRHLKVMQELPADEILLHEVILIANALGKRLEDLFIARTITII